MDVRKLAFEAVVYWRATCCNVAPAKRGMPTHKIAIKSPDEIFVLLLFHRIKGSKAIEPIKKRMPLNV